MNKIDIFRQLQKSKKYKKELKRITGLTPTVYIMLNSKLGVSFEELPDLSFIISWDRCGVLEIYNGSIKDESSPVSTFMIDERSEAKEEKEIQNITVLMMHDALVKRGIIKCHKSIKYSGTSSTYTHR